MEKTTKKTTKKARPMSKVGMKLRQLKNNGVRKVKLYYTRKDPNTGKVIPNYRTIGLSAGVIALAGTGAYLYRKHKKHGHVIQRKK